MSYLHHSNDGADQRVLRMPDVRDRASRILQLIAYALAAELAALVYVTVAVYAFGAHDPAYAPATYWLIMAISTPFQIAPGVIGFTLGLVAAPPVARHSLRHAMLLAFGIGALTTSIPIHAIGPVALLVSPLLAGLLGYGAYRLAHATGWLHRPSRDPHCRRCGYELRGATNDQCPECGSLVTDDA